MKVSDLLENVRCFACAWTFTQSLGVHPIIDVMQFDPHFQKAFEYVCGTTLVVETLDDARKVAFGGKERQKVVTVDGNLISKSGMMTGGTSTSGRIAEKARRWVRILPYPQIFNL